jgi:hypothetical protein
MRVRDVLIQGSLLVLTAVVAARGQNAGQTPAPKRPVPRWPNGVVNLGGPAGELGVWVPPNAGDERLVDLDRVEPSARDAFAIDTNPLQRTPRFDAGVAIPAGFRGKLTVSQIPFQPWARGLFEEHQLNQWEPHTRCKPSGGPRALLTPYGVEIMDRPELQRVFIFDIGGPHSVRTIYVDGKPHPANLEPSYHGHSVGRWEKDTLVVDSVGFNERFWFERHGMPHTERLHIIERFTRIDFNTLHYELTVDDPGAYTATWTTGLLLRWNSSQELFEFVCQDNNLFPSLMLESETDTPRSPIVP